MSVIGDKANSNGGIFKDGTAPKVPEWGIIVIFTTAVGLI